MVLESGARRLSYAPWRSLLTLTMSWVIASNAWSWGAQGHEVIAAVAWQGLNPQARQEVSRLLALEPGQTPESIATWADEHRSPATGVWHYVNFPRTSCNYDAQRDCPGGRCVVVAIEHQRAVLASAAGDAERLRALKYLVHLVGDVHQPLHAGYQDDRGGNRFQLQTWMHAKNLHAVWDSGMLRTMDLDNDAFATMLLAMPRVRQPLDLDPVHMAQESCRVVAQTGFYPDGDVTAAYTRRFMPVMQERLALAAARLSAMLNSAIAQSQAAQTRSAIASLPMPSASSLNSSDLEQ